MNEITITLKFPDTVLEVTLEDLINRCTPIFSNLEERDCCEIKLNVKKDGMALFATARPNENEYVGLDVDATTEDGAQLYYLGNFELPCPTYENSIAGRLYAGDARFETDSPVTLVRHDVQNKEKIDANIKKYGNSPFGPHKIVYVDTELAQYRNWTGTKEDELPEHVEDK